MTTLAITETQLGTLTAMRTAGILTETGRISGFKAYCEARGIPYTPENRKAKSDASRGYKLSKVEAITNLRPIMAAVVSSSEVNPVQLKVGMKKDKVTGNKVANGTLTLVLKAPTKADAKLTAGVRQRQMQSQLDAALAELAALKAAQAAK